MLIPFALVEQEVKQVFCTHHNYEQPDWDEPGAQAQKFKVVHSSIIFREPLLSLREAFKNEGQFSRHAPAVDRTKFKHPAFAVLNRPAADSDSHNFHFRIGV
jgi:hypothetical protein